ncbi:MAG: 5'/3'-nucleotidase SurE [Myxococcota bacterium]
MADRPLILVSNDDGVRVPGIQALREALLDVGRVVVVAPEREQSAGSHAITLSRPLRHRRLDEDVHAIDGTPVDCIYVALHHERLLPRRPDVVVSGINHGANLGLDVFYSGTVAAAREAALRRIPSIAFSMVGHHGDVKPLAAMAHDMVVRLLETTSRSGESVLLNVNFPSGEPQGVRATCLGRRHYAEGVDVREDPRGREYFWIGGPGGARNEPVEGSDTEAVEEGRVSVTPLLLRATDRAGLGVAEFVAGVREEER